MHTKKKLAYLDKREKDLLERMRQKDIKRSREKMDKTLMLDSL